MFICKYCERELGNNGAKIKHEKHCKLNPNHMSSYKLNNQSNYNIENKRNCQFCNKECHNLNSLKQHELRCKCNPDRINVNIEGFNKNTKGRENISNKGKICITNGVSNKYIDDVDTIPVGWVKGHTNKNKISGFKGKTHTQKTKEIMRIKISEARRKGIANGSITPVTSHRYINSYIKYKDGTKRFLRSSYEFIVAVFLDVCGIEFSYETVRAPYKDDEGKLHTFLSDFCINNIIIEIKGQYDSKKLEKEIEAFNNIGYELRIIHESEVMKIK